MDNSNDSLFKQGEEILKSVPNFKAKSILSAARYNTLEVLLSQLNTLLVLNNVEVETIEKIKQQYKIVLQKILKIE